MWVDLLASAEGRGVFSDRLAGLVFDCGACDIGDMTSESMEAVRCSMHTTHTCGSVTWQPVPIHSFNSHRLFRR